MSNLKARFSEHVPFNNLVADDWIAAIELDPNSFDCLLYLPKAEDKTPAQDDPYPQMEALELDENQKSLEYENPDIFSIVLSREETEGFYADESGEDSYGDNASILSAKIARHNIPVGAIVEWEEMLHDNTRRRVWWYVQAIKTLGTTKAGVIYLLIPCRDFEGVHE